MAELRDRAMAMMATIAERSLDLKFPPTNQPGRPEKEDPPEPVVGKVMTMQHLPPPPAPPAKLAPLGGGGRPPSGARPPVDHPVRRRTEDASRVDRARDGSARLRMDRSRSMRDQDKRERADPPRREYGGGRVDGARGHREEQVAKDSATMRQTQQHIN